MFKDYRTGQEAHPRLQILVCPFIFTETTDRPLNLKVYVKLKDYVAQITLAYLGCNPELLIVLLMGHTSLESLHDWVY